MTSQPQIDERQLWMPPNRLKAYQRNKALGGVLFLAIFAIWLIVQWSNTSMRYITIALMGVTAWVTIVSVIIDQSRARGRQVAVVDGAMSISTPDGETKVNLNEVSYAEWNEESDEPGLRFFDNSRKVIAHIDMLTLDDEAEARTFVGWVRKQTQQSFEVHWPSGEETD